MNIYMYISIHTLCMDTYVCLIEAYVKKIPVFYTMHGQPFTHLGQILCFSKGSGPGTADTYNKNYAHAQAFFQDRCATEICQIFHHDFLRVADNI